MNHSSNQLNLDELKDAILSEDKLRATQLFDGIHYADLAALYEDLESSSRSFFLEYIPIKRVAEVLVELPDAQIEEALKAFTPENQRLILLAMDDDNRADILQDVSLKSRQRYLSLLPSEQRESTRSLLRYGEDTAGGRMTARAARVRIGMTVKDALNLMRKDKDSTESLSRIYVVDNEGCLRGKIRLRDLAFSPWNKPVAEIMQPIDLSILATEDQETAAQMFTKYNMVLLPVVDEYNRLLGVITHDDIMEILEEESTEDIEKMSGISGESSEESYLNTPIASHFRRRFPWLISLSLFSLFSGYVMMTFQGVLSSAFLLALYLPMVVAAGGNTGGQAAAMTIRAISLGELGENTAWRVLSREALLGLFLGLGLGLSIALLTLFVLPAFHVRIPEGLTLSRFALVVSTALTVQLSTATFFGAFLPIGARAIKLDPAVVAGPAITTLVDISGMLIYFSCAKAILSL